MSPRIPQVRPEERPDAKTAFGGLLCVLMLIGFCFLAYAFVHYLAMPAMKTVIERAMEARVLF